MKSGFVAVIGRANVGKSTLMNTFIGEKIAIVSDKPQTTRNKIIGIYNDENLQIVFVDTPGFHTPKTKLGEKMISDIDNVMEDIDVALLVTECESPRNTEKKLIERCMKNNIPIILVLNKIDVTKNHLIIQTISEYAAMGDIFKAIVPVSAMKNDGVDIIMKEIIGLLPESDIMFYSDDISTDQTEKQMTAEILREKLLKNLNKEIPHGTAIETIIFKKRPDKDITDLVINIICEKESHKGIIIGKKGFMLKKVASEARLDMEKLLGTKVFLDCHVKVRVGWRDNEQMINELMN